MLALKLTLTSLGSIHAVVTFADRVMIFEFKLDKSAEVALQQIQDKKYADSYKKSGKAIQLFGVEFSTANRNILDWKKKELLL